MSLWYIKTKATREREMSKLRNVKWLSSTVMVILRIVLFFKNDSARLNFILGNLALDKGKSDLALASFRKAATCARHDDLFLADVYRKWGFALLHTEGPTEKTRELIIRSIDIVDELLNDNQFTTRILRMAANAYAAMGNFYHDKGDFREAITKFHQALVFAEDGNFIERRITVLGDMGLTALDLKDWKNAEIYINLAREDAEKHYRYALSPAFCRLGRLYLERTDGKLDTVMADALFHASFNVASKSGWKNQEADALEWLSKLRMFQGNTADSNRLHALSQNTYRKIGFFAHAKKKSFKKIKK